MNHHQLRPGLPPLPPQMRQLPVDEKTGFPVPYFVLWVDGVPDFRISKGETLHKCARESLCMICGKPLPKEEQVFAFGSLNAAMRVNDEPPMHWDCAEFSAMTCPWVLRPSKLRNSTPKATGTLSEREIVEIVETPGAIYNNTPPGAWALWNSHNWYADVQLNSTLMFHLLGDPSEVRWFTQGRRATRAEVLDAIEQDRQRLLVTHPNDTELIAKALRTLDPFIPEA